MRYEDFKSVARWSVGMSPKAIQPDTNASPLRPSVTVIVPAWNEEASIANTVRSIQQQTYPVTEILVVDDYSSDRTGEIARSLGATVARTAQNQGTKARSQNYVLDMVKTELFLTVDGDTMLAPDALEKTIRFFNDPKAAMVCGMIVPQHIDTIWTRGRFIEYLYGLTVLKPAQNHNRVVFVSSGCFSIFRTNVVRELGGFESRTMAEDMDLTWAATGAGYHTYYCHEAISYPVEPQTLSIYWKQVSRWSRAFLQNISVRKGRIESKRLGFLIYYYLFWALTGPWLLPLMFWNMSGSISFMLWTSLAAQVVLIWLPAYGQVIYQHYKGRSFGFPRVTFAQRWAMLQNNARAKLERWSSKASRRVFDFGRVPVPPSVELDPNHRDSLWWVLWQTTLCCSCFLVTQYVNLGGFLFAVYKEWLRGDTLKTWDKGH